MCAPTNISQWSPSKFLQGREDVDASKLQVISGFTPGCTPEEDVIELEGSFLLLQDGKMLSQDYDLSEPVSRYVLLFRIKGFFLSKKD